MVANAPRATLRFFALSFLVVAASASMGQPTAQLASTIKDKPELAGLRDMDSRLVILGGGLPIKVGGKLLGGIGVGGAPGGHLDEACARVGVSKIGAQ